MEKYYDITLNFYDYYIPYYEWKLSDKLDRIIKINIIKVKDINVFITNNISINTDIRYLLVSDGINALGIEIDNKNVIYISSMSFSDEESVSNIASNMEYTNIEYKVLDVRKYSNELREDEVKKRVLIKSINDMNDYLLKYIYYDITYKDSNDIDKIKRYLENDIMNNFSDKYILLYDTIIDR